MDGWTKFRSILPQAQNQWLEVTHPTTHPSNQPKDTGGIDAIYLEANFKRLTLDHYGLGMATGVLGKSR